MKDLSPSAPNRNFPKELPSTADIDWKVVLREIDSVSASIGRHAFMEIIRIHAPEAARLINQHLEARTATNHPSSTT